jgi:hypothetical protein
MGRKAVVVVALIALGILPAAAQSRARVPVRSFAARPAVSVRTVRSIPFPIRPRTVIPRTQNVPVNSSFAGSFFPGGTVQDLFGYPVPGLGFDYSDYAALNGNLGVRALIDPVTQQEIALALRLRGSFAGASPLFYSPFGGSPIVMETPVVAAQPEAPAPAPIIVVAPPAPQPAPQAQPAPPQQPLPDPGEFVLVQRDGRLLFAVAFTGEPGRLIYVTKEGLRRTIALSQLDLDATLRINEERGTTIQLPRS